MLDQYLTSTQTVDKLVATASKHYQAQDHGSDEKDLCGDAVVRRLDRFMMKETDKTTLKQGRKDAKRMGSKC